MLKRISGSTFFFKRIFPIMWFGFLLLFTAVTLVTNQTGNGPPLLFLIAPGIMAIFGYIVMKKIVFDLADEVADGGDLLLIRFGKVQEKIYLNNIMNISYIIMMNPPRVTLTLRQPCKFGKEVSFSPQRAKKLFIAKSPIITELIERVDAARNN